MERLKVIKNYITGEYESFSSNGFLLNQNKIIDSVNKVKEILDYYLDQGSIKSRKYTKANKYDGEALTYFINGKIETRTFYVDGLKQGQFEKYDLNGNKIYYGEYINDKQEGLWINIKDGKREEFLYKNNKLQVITPSKQCSCIDTTYAANKLSFAPTISSLIEYPKLKNIFLAFLKLWIA